MAQHEGTHPTSAKSLAASRISSEQIRNRTGPAYDKWRAGMLAAIVDDDNE